MQASAAFWAQWRQAQQHVQARPWAAGMSPDAMRHAAANSGGAGTGPMTAAADIGSACSTTACTSASHAHAHPGHHSSPAVAHAAAELQAGRNDRLPSEEAQLCRSPPAGSTTRSVSGSNNTWTDSGTGRSTAPPTAAAAAPQQASPSSEPGTAGLASDIILEQEAAAGMSGSRRTVAAKSGAGSPLRDVLAELRRLRALQHAPHPAWILGAPAIQAGFTVKGM